MSDKLSDNLEEQYPVIVTEIIALHEELTGLAKTTIEKASRIGELLTEIKSQIGKGSVGGRGYYGAWIEKNLPFCRKTAFNYMRVFREWKKLGDSEKVSRLSLSDVYHLLAGPDDKNAALVKGDILNRLIHERENYDILYEALGDSLRNAPLDFYQTFIAPKSGKLRAMLADMGFAGLTPSQEVKAMDESSSPAPPKEEEPTV